MWQESDFTQLPLLFDVHRLQAEVRSFDASDWVAHPSGFAGNAALILVATHGEINDDFAISGPVAPTRHMNHCPYIRQVLAVLGAPIGRTRLMRLAPGSAVPEHSDANYHWWKRMRIHIPIITQPSVAFRSGDSTVHMPAGTCWTFNNDQLHAVDNPTACARIHLVADTVGSPSLFERLTQPTTPPHTVAFVPEQDIWPTLEPYQFRVIEPLEMKRLLCDIAEQAAQHTALATHRAQLARYLDTFTDRWNRAFEQFGHDRAGELVYSGLVAGFTDEFPRPFRRGFVRPTSAWRALSIIGTMFLESNRVGPLRSQNAISDRADKQRPPAVHPDTQYEITAQGREQLRDPIEACEPTYALADAPMTLLRRLATTSHPANNPERADHKTLSSLIERGLATERVHCLPEFDRPLVIVAAPRSGSTLLYESLHRFTSVWALGRESHDIIEGVSDLRADARGSNALDERHASPAVEQRLRRGFVTGMYQHDGDRYVHLSPERRPQRIRFLEKTPKNALRMRFIERLWPSALFVYLYRDPRPSIASIMRAWRSRGFVTYPHLRGWSGRRWSLLLPPDWQRVDRRPLADVAAFQWRAANTAIMDCLEHWPDNRWLALDYEQFVRAPAAAIERICTFADLTCRFDVDRDPIDSLPLSMHTVSAPRPDKWRRQQADVLRVVADLVDVEQRFAKLVR